MSNFVLKLDYKGLDALRKSPEMTELIKGLAKDGANMCGDGYEFETNEYPSRNVAAFFPATREAKQHDKETNTALKALGKLKC